MAKRTKRPKGAARARRVKSPRRQSKPASSGRAPSRKTRLQYVALNEEIRSANEELSTANAQPKEVDERERMHSDLLNLLTSSNIAIVFLDTDLRVKLFTPPTTELLNLVGTDVGRPFRDLARKFDDPDLLARCREVLVTLAPNDREVTAESGRHYLRRIVPYRTGENHITGVVITFVDITEQIEKEAQALHLVAVVQQSNDAIVLYDLDGRILSMSRGAKRLYGYDETDTHTLTVFGLTPPEHRAEIRRLFEAAARGEDPPPFEMKRVAKDGRVLDVQMTLTTVQSEAGEPTAIIATTEHDVTEHRRTQHESRQLNEELERRITERTRQLAERESLLRAVVDAAADGIIAIDESGTIRSFNPAAARMFGNSAAEAIDRRFEAFLAEPINTGRESFSARALAAQAQSHGGALEAVGRRRDGSLFPIELAARPVEGDDLFTVVIRDISLRKELEASVQKIAVEQRNQLARELHDGLGAEMAGLGMLAQALRNRLRRVSPEDAEKATELTRYLEKCRGQLRRITQGLMPIEIPDSGLNAALRELCRGLYQLYGVKCVFRTTSRVRFKGPVATHLFHIAREAIINAIRHGKPSAVRIRLAPARQAIRLSVEDDGTGVVRAPKFTAGSGIRIMQYRAKTIGAALEILPRKKNGTAVVCTLPWDRKPVPASRRVPRGRTAQRSPSHARSK